MKKRTAPILIALLIAFVPVSTIATAHNPLMFEKTESASPGEVIALTCSYPYPTVGQPVHLIITMEGKSKERFTQPLIVTDEFSGLVATDGEMKWISGNITVSRSNITIGMLPTYVKRIAWYPSVVGNHTFYVTAGSSPKKHLTISVAFDVEGIIAPSLGCPSIIIKNTTSTLTVTISEERGKTEEPTLIEMVTLQSITSASSYHLDNQTAIWRTWIDQGEDIIEEELIASYDISTIPEGLYNISVTTPKKSYSWPHAVQLRDVEPLEYTVVHLSDIHIGKYLNSVNEKDELIRLITYINENIHPHFVILSGDLVDWYNKKAKRNVYLELQEALLFCDSPVFTTPGNHDRYGNSLLFLYVPYTNLTSYHRFLNPMSDYSLKYGDINFIYLDSGYEYSRWEIKPQILSPTPEASGLTTAQMYLLETIWGNTQMNQIIIMHHPAVNNENDTGLGALPNDLPSGNNECIAFHRGDFISYCLQNNVSLILTGHTHRNQVFTYLGKEPQNASAWPLFVQTDSATLRRQNNGGRVIHIINNRVLSYEHVVFC
ncbi:MAG: hypothetical protein BV459_04240 [Thermoplasmata archaeon M11B2D]|nr:MAG: hypothetical protein BV459_04240 [Thermoplasmata archaeon M11B2D]PNX54048.1 MAG: hypothetical protein BV458_01270 [Thermoplasmata archaeon M9B2D]